MDKLEPVLKQKFWILLGIGIILTLTGWWMTTGSLAATINQRVTTLDGLEKSIPSGETPNSDWATQLSAINDRQTALVDVAKRELWERQKAQMFWPPNVDNFAANVPYRGDFPLVATVLYRENVVLDAERVWKMCRPFQQVDQTGIVWFPFQKLPVKTNFGELTPTSQELWENQEDLWLLVPIMKAINNLNGGENATRQDAVLHVIDKLQLMGGDRDKLAGSGGGSMSSSDGVADPMAMGALGGLSLGGSGGGSANAIPTSADFDPKEEYGDGGTPGAGGAMTMDFGGSGSTMPADGAGADGTMGGGSAPVIRRYVDDSDALPYKTRAFYLSVIMDHRMVPRLIGELTANGESDWPIEIGRVQVVRLNPDEGMSLTTGGNLAMGGTMGGSSMSSNYAGAFGGSSGFNASSLLTTSPSSIGAGAESSYNPEPTTEVAGEYSGTGTSMQQQRSATASFEAALLDPNMARVALCGLIYIYKEVQPPAAPEGGTSPPAEGSAPVADGAVPVDPNAAPAETTAPTETPQPADAPAADPNAAQPATTEPNPAAPAPAANEAPGANPPAPQ